MDKSYDPGVSPIVLTRSFFEHVQNRPADAAKISAHYESIHAEVERAAEQLEAANTQEEIGAAEQAEDTARARLVELREAVLEAMQKHITDGE